MTRCNICSSYVADEMAFCTNCGEPLEFETVIRPAATAASFELSEPPKSKKVGVIAAGIAGLCVFGGVLYFVGKGTAEPKIIAVPVNQIVYVTPTPPPRTPEPTPEVVRTPKPKTTPISIDEMRERYDRIDPPIPANRPIANANANTWNKAANANTLRRPPFRGAKCEDGTTDSRPLYDARRLCEGHGRPIQFWTW
ncbi:MAG: hypothetical protein IPG22_20385 [Acidobacteria bacterium]|nr:hypothetical protein [Acidobacteriota bacterium]